MNQQKIVTSSDTAALENDSFPNAQPPRQATELLDARTSGNGVASSTQLAIMAWLIRADQQRLMVRWPQ